MRGGPKNPCWSPYPLTTRPQKWTNAFATPCKPQIHLGFSVPARSVSLAAHVNICDPQRQHTNTKQNTNKKQN